MRIRHTLAAISAAALVSFSLALGSVHASANTGTVTGSENCQTFSVVIALNHNVSPDRFVIVTTTIPGTVGIAAPGNHYNTTFGTILTLTGNAPATGTVTLRINNSNGTLDWQGTSQNGGSLTVHPNSDCPTPTATPRPTPTPVTTPTPHPTPTPTPRPVPTPTPVVPTPTPFVCGPHPTNGTQCPSVPVNIPVPGTGGA